MQFGVLFANTGASARPDGAVALAAIAEEAGFESLWAVEHVVVPAAYESRYPYSTSGQLPGTGTEDIPDPLIWSTWVAAATTRLRVATGVLVLPQRNPLVLAKEAATLDFLSGGRFVLGVGVGWLEEELVALGVPLEHRGERAEEYIAAMRALWTEDVAGYQGRFVSFDGVRSFPKPVQAGGVPIVVGGDSARAARRAGTIGDGYFPGDAGDGLAARLDVMRAAATAAGRAPEEIEVTIIVPRERDAVRRAEDLGVSRVLIRHGGADEDAWRARLGTFADNVIAGS